MKIICDIYKSANKAQTYLYLKKELDMQELPEELSQLLGELSLVMRLAMDDATKLAQVKAPDVLASLKEQGYFLQMPPGEYLKTQAPGQDFIQ